MHSRVGLAVIPLLVGALGACSSDNGSEPKTDPNTFRYVTDEFTVDAYEEQYLCYAQTLEEDLEVDRFDYSPAPVIHHALVSRTLAPEPEGLSECNIIYKTNWLPMFAAGASTAELELPADSSYQFKKGDQILIQLHLLNNTDKKVSARARIDMRKTQKVDAKPVGLYVFGTSSFKLPPQQTTDVVNDCTMKDDIEVFAVLPHMHFLGNKLVFEVGDSTSALTESFRREEWSFDDQRVEPHELVLKSGTETRVTCTFDNTTDKEVTYGESSFTEMCVLATFVKGRVGIDACFDTSGF